MSLGKYFTKMVKPKPIHKTTIMPTPLSDTSANTISSKSKPTLLYTYTVVRYSQDRYGNHDDEYIANLCADLQRTHMIYHTKQDHHHGEICHCDPITMDHMLSRESSYTTGMATSNKPQCVKLRDQIQFIAESVKSSISTPDFSTTNIRTPYENSFPCVAIVISQ
jgi:hypothetical protein